jgi:hypothetical protein
MQLFSNLLNDVNIFDLAIFKLGMLLKFASTFKHKKMKIILTGSLGNIWKPLTQQLVQKGHQVTVISSNLEKI